VADMVTLRARIREAFDMFDKDGKGTIVDECVCSSCSPISVVTVVGVATAVFASAKRPLVLKRGTEALKRILYLHLAVHQRGSHADAVPGRVS
jgi:hypothetical protein